MPEASLASYWGSIPGGADIRSYAASRPTICNGPSTGLADDAWDALNQVKQAINSPDLPGDPSVLAAGIDSTVLGQEGEQGD